MYPLCIDPAVAVYILVSSVLHTSLDELQLFSQVSYGGGTCDGGATERTLNYFFAHPVCNTELNKLSIAHGMSEAEEAGIAELKAFALQLRQDIKAVVAAMVMSYSQGQTDGRVNKVKLIKRSMYGRGKFDLLRQLVLYTPAS